jgi:hypothetical protein
MNYQYKYTEMTTPNDYSSWSPPPPSSDNPPIVYQTTKQYGKRGMSCWEYFFNRYNDKLWFDLDHNNREDTTFLSTYTALSGPEFMIEGGNTEVDVVNT